MIDLHSHSTHSDGTKTPSELLNLAKNSNITIYAITDHDDIEGSKRLVATPHDGITVYSGVELNAKVDKGQMHILGYNIDLSNKELNDKLKELKENSKHNIMLYVNQLKEDYNIELPKEDIDKILNREGNIGRPLLALLLIKYGYVESVSEAFDKYLGDEKVRQHKMWITKEECIKLINNAGGVAVLAHPFTLKLTNEELKEELKYLISIGLKGIEIIHSKSTEEQREYYKELAKDFSLITTGGTDYHGPEVKPNIELGTGIKNNVNVMETDISLPTIVPSRY
ncbi:MAG: PHP domain-containing protein [Firmicutes bacterium]|nr:PHP domain-containing protein [Bacillota bacterium]